MLKTVLVLAAAASVEVNALRDINGNGLNSNDKEREIFIREINSVEQISWTAGHNSRFHNQPLDAHKELCGVKNIDENAALIAANTEVYVADPDVEIPDDFDSETNWPACAKVIGDIRDQSNCGCCWAFGAASAASDRLCIASKASMAVPLSAEALCFCSSSDGCDGGDTFTPWNFIKHSGLVTGGQYNNTGALGGGYCSAFSLPHCHHHGPQGNDPYPAEGTPGCPSDNSPRCPHSCDSAAVAPHNDYKKDRYTFKGSVVSYRSAKDLQASIMANGPTETAFTVYGDFANYVSGIYHHVSGSVLGGHAVRIVGWGVDNGQDYWKVANSWNPWWGENGYFRIKRGDDECGIESGATSSSGDATWGMK